jgi:glucose-6-phosphate isomerase
MGIRCEWADLSGTGIDRDTWLRRAGEVNRDAVSGAGFATDLDRDYALPRTTPADRVVVLGIGGSALGARCVHEATRTPEHKPIEVVDNIDPEALERAWNGGDPARTAWVVVSKSGGTTETLAQATLVRRRLADARLNPPFHIVTGPSGPLREMAEATGNPSYPVPEEVGGRFSVFTPAATVPLALAGHDVPALLAGARAMRDHCAEADSAGAQLAAWLAAGAGQGRNIVALWSYAERLEVVGEWFRQLWAESLGKVRADGTRVGQTPLHCVGSTDQHSIQQLLVEGPRDKMALVLAGPPTGEAAAPAGEPGAGAGHPLSGILDAMRRATTAGMVRAGCPAATLHLENWGERDIGALLMLFLCATVYGGELLGVDPYGQPGVEAAKIATKELLKDPEGQAAREIGALLGEPGGRVVP